MKVLFWMSTSFNTTSRHLLTSVLEALCSGDNTITVLKKSVDDGTDDVPAEIKNMNIEIISVPVSSSPKSDFVSRYLNDLRYVANCKKCIKSDFDAVFVQSSNVAGFVFKFLSKRFPNAVKTFNVQDIFPENAVYSGKVKKNGIVYQVLSHSQRQAYAEADHIITVSEDMKELLINVLGVKSEKIEVIYNWSYQDDLYDVNSIDKSAVSNILKDGCFNVVYAGNIGVMQNVEVIIEAANILKAEKDIWFNIIGDGLYKEKLKNRAVELGLYNISFSPMQPALRAPCLYSSADINIIPLSENIYKTALPSKTATCMACQRPIVFAVGKNSQFCKRVSNETGCFVVDSNDAEGMAKAILEIKNQNIVVNTKEFFVQNMSRTKNSTRYAEIITGRIGK